MQAHPGDWLIVHSHTDAGPVRKAEIIATHTGGDPPFTVRWIDDNRESVVFPGPDAEIVSAAQNATNAQAQDALITRVQTAIDRQDSTEQ